MRATFYVTGAVLELGGILLVAWPDFLPYAARASRALHALAERLGDRLRRLLRRPRHKVVHVGAGGAVAATGSISGVVSVSNQGSLEDRVEFLLRREEATQQKLNAHDERLRAIEENVPERLDELRAETEEHVANELSAAESRYRPLRFVGALLLAAGLGLTTAGNFV
jgi:hypothetical protein